MKRDPKKLLFQLSVALTVSITLVLDLFFSVVLLLQVLAQFYTNLMVFFQQVFLHMVRQAAERRTPCVESLYTQWLIYLITYTG